MTTAKQLIDACRKGHINVVKEFIKNGADINMTDTDGHTAIHIACGWGHTKIVQFLLDNGAVVNVTSEDGSTPLHHACETGYIYSSAPP
jgi:ankyrin repeat protein